MPIYESGITLDFPDNNFFRFQDCRGYKAIQQNFKEMDACWYDQQNDILYIIELKDWGDGSLIEESDTNVSEGQFVRLKGQITHSRINTLFKKTVDSVCMFVATLLQTPYSVQIQNCAPFTITADTKIKLLSIINWTKPDTTYIAQVNTAYKTLFKPYATLFGIKSYVVLTKSQAHNIFGWVN